MIKNYKILSIGDCNTQGVKELKFNSYPERLARKISSQLINCGFTMSTTREGIEFFSKNYTQEINIITIQYGLVDSWKTFKYSPYILYYPDNFFRKIGRKILKKIKKILKKIKLNDILGTKNVVNIFEYQNNLESIIQKVDKNSVIFLIETIPNKELFRNDEIVKYNNILKIISEKYENCIYVDIYDDFANNFKNWYYDDTHINSIGYEFISDKIFNLLENQKLEK